MKNQNILRLLFLLFSLVSFPSYSAFAQGVELCRTDGNFEPPSETQRTVKLSNFNIAINIPGNYRTMMRQDGTVEILHPDDFEILQCVARGGAGSGGYYSETIRIVEPDPSMTLQQQAILSVGYEIDAAGRRIPAYTNIIEYNQNSLSGYIVESISGYSTTFLGTYPGSQRLLEITASCDCAVEVQDVTNLLSNITFLD